MISREHFVNALKVPVKWGLRQTVYHRAVHRPAPGEKPYLIRIDINNRCNLRCKQCFYLAYLTHDLPAHNMSVEEFRTIASRLFNHTYHLQFACSFEPLLHPQFLEMLEITDQYPIRDVGISTNGTLLDAEKAEAILESRTVKSVSVSIDGITGATYEAIRGRPLLDRVLANVERFQELKKRKGKQFPGIKINTTIMRSNLKELPGIFKWASEHGIFEVQFFHVEPFDKGTGESALNAPEEFNAAVAEVRAIAKGSGTGLLLPPPMIPEFCDSQTGRYRRSSFRRESVEKPGVRVPSDPSAHPYPSGLECVCPWMVLMIDARGDVYPCAHRAGRDPFANIIRQPLFDAMNSIKFLRLRQDMLRGGRKLACSFCEPLEFPYSDPLQGKISHLEPEND